MERGERGTNLGWEERKKKIRGLHGNKEKEGLTLREVT